jgi:hypothetical protein
LASVGFVLSISYKDPANGKVHTMELYCDPGDIIPLTPASGRIPLYDAERVAKLSPTIAIQEIRVRKISKD